MPTASPGFSKNTYRFASIAFFFCQGLCFSSWASRIPDIKNTLHLSEAGLGSMLLALPAGQLSAMPFSGRLVTFFGSKKVMTLALPLYALALSGIGHVSATWQLPVALYLFGITGNLVNISVNTQAVAVEAFYPRPIMASFHGAWSLAGFTGASIGTLMISLHWLPFQHFYVIGALVLIVVFSSTRFLLPGKPTVTVKRPFFTKPDKALLQLGVIGFCSLATEGAMFDWSGVYFQKVVHSPASLITLGYAAFMSTMATGRFVGDRLVHRFGRKKMLEASGILIIIGLGISVAFPYIIPVTIGFLITGFGVSSVIPTLYSVAGRSSTVSPGIAIASVSGISFFGFLMGPPVIGYIAQAFSLRASYGFIAVLGFCITLLTARATLISQKVPG